MKIKVDLDFDFSNESWICNFEGKILKATTLEELQDKFYNLLKEKGLKGKIKIKISYNWKNLPQWLWQYQSYYFEREWVFKL